MIYNRWDRTTITKKGESQIMKYISFPGLGIEPFHMDRAAFSVFGHDIMWYGIIIALGMVLAYIYASGRAKYEGVKSDDLVDIGLGIIIFGIIGARLYYVAFELDQFIVTSGSFWSNLGLTLKNIVSIWHGGLAIYGGIIGGAAAALVISFKKKLKWQVTFDMLAPTVMIGQILGRWGNFVNVEAYGSETNSFLRMGIHTALTEGGEFYREIYVHPTFLYESVWNLVGFIIIASTYHKKKFNGQIALEYLMWYGFGRFFIEGLRTDSLMLGSLRVSQVLSALIFTSALVLFIVFTVKTKTPDFAAVMSESDETDKE